MDFKVNEEKWQELMYFVNNFFKPIAFTSGRGLYPDRITLARGRSYHECLAPEKNVEFYTFNTRSAEYTFEAKMKIRDIAEKTVTDAHFMNEVLNVGNKVKKNYSKLFEYTQNMLLNSKITNFEKINEFLVKVYKKLDAKDLLKITSFREECIDICIKEGFFSPEFGQVQKDLLPNSLIKLSTDFD